MTQSRKRVQREGGREGEREGEWKRGGGSQIQGAFSSPTAP